MGITKRHGPRIILRCWAARTARFVFFCFLPFPSPYVSRFVRVAAVAAYIRACTGGRDWAIGAAAQGEKRRLCTVWVRAEKGWWGRRILCSRNERGKIRVGGEKINEGTRVGSNERRKEKSTRQKFCFSKFYVTIKG